MIYSSLAILALASSAAIPSLGNLVHLHPHAQQDSRINVVLYNKSESFRDLKIDGHNYTIRAHATLGVKAPAGTVIYLNSYMPRHHVGEALLSLTPAQNNTRIDLN